jgi:putative transposase
MHAHLVFVTKYRPPVVTNTMLTQGEQLIREVCTSIGAQLSEFNGDTDHVHLLVHDPPSLAPSVLVHPPNGVWARRLPQRYRRHVGKYLWGNHFWSPSSFAASCAGAPLTIIKQTSTSRTAPTNAAALRGPKEGIGFLPAVNGQASAEEIPG